MRLLLVSVKGHGHVRVARADHRVGRKDCVDRRKLGRRQANRARREVRVEVRDLGRARDRRHVGALRGQPRERELPDRAALGLGERGDAVDQLEIRVDRPRAETRLADEAKV